MQKKWVIGITAVSLAAATAIGSTLAYFTTKTTQMTNNFTVATGDKGITGQLRESNWDGYGFGDYVNQGTAAQRDPNGTDVTDKTNTGLGINQAKIMLPGDTIQKNPTLKNTTNCDDSGKLIAGKSDVPVYMAMKVTKDQFVNATFQVNDGWKKLDNCTFTDGTTSEVYVWCGIGATALTPKAVASGAQTDKALFDTVQIDRNAIQQSSAIGSNDSSVLKAFNLQLQGSAIQARNLDVTDPTNGASNLNEVLTDLAKELGATYTPAP